MPNIEVICSRGEIDFSSEGWSAVSPAAVDLVKQMVDKDPAKRPTVEEVLKKEWVKNPPVIVGVERDDEA